MPEIVDLEVSRENMLRKVQGRRIVAFDVTNPKILRNATVEQVRTLVVGKTLKNVARVAKILRFELEDVSLAVHLMLHGDFHWQTKDIQHKNVVCSIAFDCADIIVITDWSAWVQIELHAPCENFVAHSLSKKYGVNPLSDDCTEEMLLHILERKPRSMIKAVLMDQELIAGIGNAYTDEILWNAEIHPTSRSGGIVKADRTHALFLSMKDVVSQGIKTVQDLSKNIDICEQPRDFMKVYRKSGSKCPRCGYMITRLKVHGRDTFICEKCQRKFK